MPNADIASSTFKSGLDVRAMLPELTRAASDIAWSTRESEYDGVYVLGRTADGIKIRIVDEGARFAVESWFPPAMAAAARRAFAARVAAQILPAVQAEDVVEEA